MVFRRPFQPGVFLATAGIAALVMVTIVAVPQWLAQRARLAVLRLHVAEVAQLAASTVDGDLHRQLLDPANYTPERYARALEPLVRFHSAIPDAFYVYTMVGRQGETFFVLDTSTSPALTAKHKLRASAYMERFNLRSEYTSDWLQQIGSGHTWVTPSFQVDAYGYFLTGHAPINDTVGHTAGDAAITRLAATIRATIRGDDIAARIGGDEFLIVAPRCNEQAAAKIAAQIINRLAAPSENQPACSVSVGICIEEGIAGFDRMYRRADEALYRAKAAGKKRSVVYRSS